MSTPQKIRCRVDRLTDHGDHVYTVDLLPERRLPAFRPGQFMHLALDEYDPSGFWPDSRVFSIASSPTDREHLRLLYSVKGRFTTRMERELVVGSHAWVKLPYGEFVIEGNQDVVLFAGGTGISAFTAFLEGLPPSVTGPPPRASGDTQPATRHVCLFYGARRLSLLLYARAVQAVAQRTPALQARFFAEDASAPDCLSVPVAHGRLSVAAAWPTLESPLAAVYYLSGPPAMLKALSTELRNRDIAAASIRVDAWE